MCINVHNPLLGRDRYRDQIVARLYIHSVIWVCLCIPRDIHSSCSTVMALLCILYQYPSLFPLPFVQSLLNSKIFFIVLLFI